MRQARAGLPLGLLLCGVQAAWRYFTREETKLAWALNPSALGLCSLTGDIGEEKREARAAGPPPSCGPPAPSAACAGRRPLHAGPAMKFAYRVSARSGRPSPSFPPSLGPLRASALTAALSGFFFFPPPRSSPACWAPSTAVATSASPAMAAASSAPWGTGSPSST